MSNQNGKGDFTLLYNGTIYRFPTESERWDFLQEEAKTDDEDTYPDALIVGVQPAS